MSIADEVFPYMRRKSRGSFESACITRTSDMAPSGLRLTKCHAEIKDETSPEYLHRSVSIHVHIEEGTFKDNNDYVWWEGERNIHQ